jgi:hypothetical protein
MSASYQPHTSPLRENVYAGRDQYNMNGGSPLVKRVPSLNRFRDESPVYE